MPYTPTDGTSNARTLLSSSQKLSLKPVLRQANTSTGMPSFGLVASFPAVFIVC